jgi:hypothetical protein
VNPKGIPQQSPGLRGTSYPGLEVTIPLGLRRTIRQALDCGDGATRSRHFGWAVVVGGHQFLRVVSRKAVNCFALPHTPRRWRDGVRSFRFTSSILCTAIRQNPRRTRRNFRTCRSASRPRAQQRGTYGRCWIHFPRPKRAEVSAPGDGRTPLWLRLHRAGFFALFCG